MQIFQWLKIWYGVLKSAEPQNAFPIIFSLQEFADVSIRLKIHQIVSFFNNKSV